MSTTTVILLAQTAATLLLTGLAWFVQLVFYPAYPLVGQASFQRFEQQALRRVYAIVSPLMLIEAATAARLLIDPPAPVGAVLAAVGAGSVATVWISTFVIQWPLHRRLAREGWHLAAIRQLIFSQWIRTVGWTLHGLIVLLMLIPYLR